MMTPTDAHGSLLPQRIASNLRGFTWTALNHPELPLLVAYGSSTNLERAPQRLREGCIGAELAKAGFRLVVYFSNDDSLEPHVVAGYGEVLATNPALAGHIRVRYAKSQRGQVLFHEQVAQPELFEIQLFPGQDWETPFYRSLAEDNGVDAVVLLAGATSTLIAGQIAFARRLPILAVDEFGGRPQSFGTKLHKLDRTAAPPHGVRVPQKILFNN